MSEITDDTDLLREIADEFLNNARRCYRIARAARDIQVRERLLDLAREFEERAEAVRARARDALR